MDHQTQKKRRRLVVKGAPTWQQWAARRTRGALWPVSTDTSNSSNSSTSAWLARLIVVICRNTQHFHRYYHQHFSSAAVTTDSSTDRNAMEGSFQVNEEAVPPCRRHFSLFEALTQSDCVTTSSFVDRPQWLLNTPCHSRVLPNNDNCHGFSFFLYRLDVPTYYNYNYYYHLQPSDLVHLSWHFSLLPPFRWLSISSKQSDGCAKTKVVAILG